MRTAAILFFLFISGCVAAQDTLTWLACQQMAKDHAPRLKDLESIEQIGALKLNNASTSWYPSLDLNGKISYQSDVVEITISEFPVQVEFPEVPHDQYGLNLDISQTLYDGGITKQKKQYEQSLTAADLQQVEVDLYGLRSQVNQSYFAILILQENLSNLKVHLDMLNRKREVMNRAVESGTLLVGDLKVMDVEILKVRQTMVEVETRKQAFLAVLSLLCGVEFQEITFLQIPELDRIGPSHGNRPEYRWFDLKDASMEAGKALLSRKRMPLLYAFGQTGYGKPGYNMMSGEWDYYYMVGAGLKWNIWDWNVNKRDRQVIEQQQQILRNQRSSFDQKIESLKAQEEAKMEQYRKSMELEQEVLELQQEISEQAATQLAHGTITATDYITELNKESITRINLATHRVQLMQSIANYLTIQGNL